MTSWTHWWSLRVCGEKGSKYQDGEIYLNPFWGLDPGRYVCPRKMGAVSQLSFPPKLVVSSSKTLRCEGRKGPASQSTSEHQDTTPTHLASLPDLQFGHVFWRPLPLQNCKTTESLLWFSFLPWLVQDIGQEYISSIWLADLQEVLMLIIASFLLYFCCFQYLIHRPMHLVQVFVLWYVALPHLFWKIFSFITRWTPLLQYLSVRIHPSRLWDP